MLRVFECKEDGVTEKWTKFFTLYTHLINAYNILTGKPSGERETICTWNEMHWPRIESNGGILQTQWWVFRLHSREFPDYCSKHSKCKDYHDVHIVLSVSPHKFQRTITHFQISFYLPSPLHQLIISNLLTCDNGRTTTILLSNLAIITKIRVKATVPSVVKHTEWMKSIFRAKL